VKGDATADTLAIVGKADTDNVINASTITVDTATVSIKGANKVDTLTGTASADTFVATIGADVISGGSGNDTFTFNAADDATIDGKGGSNTVALAAAVDLTSNVVSFANIQTLQLDSGNANVLAASQVTGLTLTAFGGDFKASIF